jgi:MoxR-like ATPase
LCFSHVFAPRGPRGPLDRGKVYIPLRGIYHGMQSKRRVTKQDSRKTLYEFLQENDFYVDHTTADLLEKITSNTRKAIMLRGPAGVGKTQLTYLVSRWLGSEYVYFQCTYGTDEDMLLYKYIPTEQTKSGIKIALGPVPRALMMSQKKKVVLVLDEFDKTRPSADALLLDVLQNYRLSLYLDDNETIITGNPENLIVFLTSNDMREFSEPLLRRLVLITLRPLPTTTVYEILKKQFKENVALLLTQIYDDTVKAGLRKPATIQELTQLGEVLESGVNVQLQDLIRMFIVKYDDDWSKYLQYVSSREPYKFVNDNANSIDVSQYYEPPQEVQIPQPQEQKGQTTQTTQLLEKISKLVVKQPNSTINAVKEEIHDTTEVTFKAPISENDFTMYTNIISTFWPEPTERPDVFGKFKIVRDNNEYKIISEESLTLLEYISLLHNNTEFEGYIEDKLIFVNPATINKILSEAHVIRYYSNKKVQVQYSYHNSAGCDLTELIEIEPLGRYSPNKQNTLDETIIRMYVNVKKQAYAACESLIRKIIEKLHDIDISDPDPYMLLRFIKQDIEFRKRGLAPGIEVTLRGNFEKIMDVLGKEFKLDVKDKDIDAIKSKGIMKIYYNEYYGTLEVRPL